MEGASHNTIAYCTFSKMRNLRLWQGSRLYWNSQYNWIHHCTFSEYGSHANSTDTGTVVAIGEEENQTDHSWYNRFEDNTLYFGGHDVMSLDARYTVIRRNRFHNGDWNGHGMRNLITTGYEVESGWNLIEGNIFSYSGYPVHPSEAGSAGCTIATRNNIIRGNLFYHNNENGLILSHTANYMDVPSHNRIYHNTFFHNGFNTNPDEPHEALCGLGFALWSRAGSETISGNVVKNNIFWKNAKAWDSYPSTLVNAQTFVGNWEEAADPKFIDASATLGNEFDFSRPNLRLQSASPCIDAGMFLTMVTSAAGSGRSFTVGDSLYFTDGWGVVPGDEVQLEGTSQRARITSINQTTKTIGVDADLNWKQNQGLSLAYSGSKPDIGAFEEATVQSPPSAPTNLRIVE